MTRFLRMAALFCAAMLLYGCSPAAQPAANVPAVEGSASSSVLDISGHAGPKVIPEAADGAEEAVPDVKEAANEAVKTASKAEEAIYQAEYAAPEAEAAEAAADPPSNALLPCPNYDAAMLDAHMRDTAPMALPDDLSGLLGATMPHYAPMMKLGVSLLRAVMDTRAAAGKPEIETVLLLGPNHAGAGPAVELSGLGYFWPDGSVEGDEDAAEFLRLHAGIETAEDRSVLDTEYSASLWAPYVSQLLPGAKVVTILFTRGVQTEDLSRLAGAISALAAEKRIFVLCSIDFSHYQTPQVMRERDRVTRRTVETGDILALRNLDGTYLDCPEALSVLLLCGEVRELAYETITFQENGLPQGASYFVFSSHRD